MDTFERVYAAGLTKKEASIYASLLDHGQQSLSDLHRSTQINRPALYDVLPALERKGLVSKVKHHNRYQYVAESPKKLLEQYRNEVEKETVSLTELAETFEKQDEERPVVKYFASDHDLAYVYDDVIHTLPVGAEFYRYSSRANVPFRMFGNSLYAKKRDERKLERLVITSAAKAKDKQPKLERSVRAVPEDFDLFEDNISLLIYGSKTAYIDYSSKTSFIIESAKIARFQHKLFKLLWKKLS